MDEAITGLTVMFVVAFVCLFGIGLVIWLAKREGRKNRDARQKQVPIAQDLKPQELPMPGMQKYTLTEEQKHALSKRKNLMIHEELYVLEEENHHEQ